jgi:hypothetical protein
LVIDSQSGNNIAGEKDDCEESIVDTAILFNSSDNNGDGDGDDDTEDDVDEITTLTGDSDGLCRGSNQGDDGPSQIEEVIERPQAVSGAMHSITIGSGSLSWAEQKRIRAENSKFHRPKWI